MKTFILSVSMVFSHLAIAQKFSTEKKEIQKRDPTVQRRHNPERLCGVPQPVPRKLGGLD